MAMKQRGRGFGSMKPAKARAARSKGGRAAHVAKTAHEWTKEEASAAGKKGGSAPHKARRGVVAPVVEEAPVSMTDAHEAPGQPSTDDGTDREA